MEGLVFRMFPSWRSKRMPEIAHLIKFSSSDSDKYSICFARSPEISIKTCNCNWKFSTLEKGLRKFRKFEEKSYLLNLSFRIIVQG